MNWDDIIKKLDEYEDGKSGCEDYGLEPPSKAAIKEARRYVASKPVNPPMRICPDGDGGITMEWENSTGFFTAEFDPKSVSTIHTFIDGKLVKREVI
jgi:hypothetical protein